MTIAEGHITCTIHTKHALCGGINEVVQPSFCASALADFVLQFSGTFFDQPLLFQTRCIKAAHEFTNARQ